MPGVRSGLVIKQRVSCAGCERSVAVTYGGRIVKHNAQRNGGEVCTGTGYMVGPREVASVLCPTCKGAGVIRPGAIRP